MIIDGWIWVAIIWFLSCVLFISACYTIAYIKLSVLDVFSAKLPSALSTDTIILMDYYYIRLY